MKPIHILTLLLIVDHHLLCLNTNFTHEKWSIEYYSKWHITYFIFEVSIHCGTIFRACLAASTNRWKSPLFHISFVEKPESTTFDCYRGKWKPPPSTLYFYQDFHRIMNYLVSASLLQRENPSSLGVNVPLFFGLLPINGSLWHMEDLDKVRANGPVHLISYWT